MGAQNNFITTKISTYVPEMVQIETMQTCIGASGGVTEMNMSSRVTPELISSDINVWNCHWPRLSEWWS